jgi:DNA-binding NtrC family response regulator
VKLLRVLQQREVIPVGATEAIPIDAHPGRHQPRPRGGDQAGNFRRDLFYRLNVIALHLPPLRAPRDDIPLLADAFLQRGAAAGEAPKRLSDEAADALLAYAWPGNVRELENALERAVILTEGATIAASALPETRHGAPERAAGGGARDAQPAHAGRDRAGVHPVGAAVASRGNKTRAAEVRWASIRRRCTASWRGSGWSRDLRRSGRLRRHFPRA